MAERGTKFRTKTKLHNVVFVTFNVIFQSKKVWMFYNVQTTTSTFVDKNKKDIQQIVIALCNFK